MSYLLNLKDKVLHKQKMDNYRTQCIELQYEIRELTNIANELGLKPPPMEMIRKGGTYNIYKLANYRSRLENYRNKMKEIVESKQD